MKVQLKRGKCFNSRSEIRIEYELRYRRNSCVWRVGTTTVLEILNMHPEELSEDKCIDPREESDCGKQDEDVLEERDTSKNMFLRFSTTLEVQRIKC